MNRDEILEAAGVDPDHYVPGHKVIEGTEGAHVRAHADVYWTRVLVHPETVADGEKITNAGDVIPVALVENVIVDPACRMEGWGRALMIGVHQEIQRHPATPYAVTVGCLRFFHRWGYEALPGAAREDLLVAALYTNPSPAWPPGRFDLTRGRTPE